MKLYISINPEKKAEIRIRETGQLLTIKRFASMVKARAYLVEKNIDINNFSFGA